MSLGNPAECAGVMMVRGSDRMLRHTHPVRPETRSTGMRGRRKTNVSRPFYKHGSRRIAVKGINHLGNQAMKVFRA